MISLTSRDSAHEQRELLATRSQQLLVRWANQIKEPSAYSLPYLGHGSVLNAIVLQEAAALHSREDYLTAAAQHLEHGAGLLDKMPLSSSMYRGIVGVGWAMQTFAQPELIPWRDEFLDDLDDLLGEALEVTSNLNIDIINGLAGIAVYGIARGHQRASSKALWQVLDQKLADYLTHWHVGFDHGHTVESVANNLGIAHGVPGVLAVGAVAAQRRLVAPSTGAIVKEGLDRLWAAALVDGESISFPSRYGDTKPARLAWCYGGLGVATTFRLGIELDQANVKRTSLLCRSSLAQYAAGTHQIQDASLCHGHAGAALTFDSLARVDQLDADLVTSLRAASLDACVRALDAEVDGESGSTFMHATRQGLSPSSTFLEGGPGVALSLAAMFQAKSPRWMDLLGYY